MASVSRICLLIIAFGFSQGQAQNLPNTLLWRVSGNGLQNASYLFGTYHLMDSGFVAQHPEVRRRLEACKRVVGELDMATMNPLLLAQAAMLPDSVSLKSLFTEMQIQRLDSVLKSLGAGSMALYNRFMPQMVSQTISLLVLQQETGRKANSLDASASLDGYLQTLAKRKGLEVLGLETVQDQVNALFKSATLEEQAKDLAEIPDSLAAIRIQARVLDSCYMHQNLNCMLHLLESQQSLDGSQRDALLENRNSAWVARLKTMMAQKPSFVAVGALHLPGEQGLLALLREAGYKVEPVAN